MRIILLLVVTLLPNCLFAQFTLGKSNPTDVVSRLGPAVKYTGPANNLKSSDHQTRSNYYQVKYRDNKVSSITIWGPSSEGAVAELISSNSGLEFGPAKTQGYFRNRFYPTTGKQERQKRILMEYFSKCGKQVLRATKGENSKNIGYIYLGNYKKFNTD